MYGRHMHNSEVFMSIHSNGNHASHAQNVSSQTSSSAHEAPREIVLPKSSKKAQKHGHGIGFYVLLILAFLVVLLAGMCLGHYVSGIPFPNFSSQHTADGQTLTEDQLKLPIASYEIDGKHVDVIAQDVITQKRSLENSKKDDGTYPMPSAEDIMGYIRTSLLKNEADNQGIDASDDEVSDFAKTSLGTDDMSVIAKNYGMDEDKVKDLLRTSVILDKLRKQVVTTQAPTIPELPKAPAAGKEKEPSAEYAQYIIKLAGDEWDSSADAWKSSDSTYAKALSKFDISSKGATFDAVRIAYSIAMQKANQIKQAGAAEWKTFVNKTFGRVSVSLNTLGA